MGSAILFSGMGGKGLIIICIEYMYLYPNVIVMKKEVSYTICSMLLAFIINTNSMAQGKPHMYRIAKIQIDLAQLDQYNDALKEQMATAIRLEPGVLSYYAVADKKDVSHITIFET